MRVCFGNDHIFITPALDKLAGQLWYITCLIYSDW